MQFTDLLVLMLVAASIVSMALGQYPAAVTIILIVIFNAWLGVTQEAKAEASLAALQALSAPVSQVKRDGVTVQVDSGDLVLGDVVELETGQKVAADIRLISCQDLQTNEMALTGEK
jgi:Ca2+-transporting ATPase